MVYYFDGKYHSANHCPKCNSFNIKYGKTYYEEHILVECEVQCLDCENIDHWAYGFYEGIYEEAEG